MIDKKYDFDEIPFKDLKEKVDLPTFQRNLVWKPSQKKSFIDTIKSGLPFGSIMLYKNMEKYSIVDGLQRFSTLRDYEDNPWEYIEINEESFPRFNDATRIIISVYTDKTDVEVLAKLKELIKEGLHKQKGHLSAAEINNIVFSVVEEFNKLKSNFEKYTELQTVLSEMLDKINIEADIADLKIPAVVFTGSFNLLPEIFEKLNSKGTKLSRYEIFASTWNSYMLNYNDIKILKLVEDKYINLEENTGIDVKGFEKGSIIGKKQINLYEYCFAISKIIKDAAPSLIASSDSGESIGFTTLAAITGVNLNKLNDLPDKINIKVSAENLFKLANVIEDSYKEVDKILSGYVRSPDGKKSFAKPAEAQLVSIVGTYFQIKYNLSTELKITSKSGTSTNINLFVKRMPYAFLYDTIRGYWAGTGDKKCTRELQKALENNRYLSCSTSEAWEQALTEWMDSQINNSPVKAVSAETKLFTNFICRRFMPAGFESMSVFDIEHIVPRDKVEKLDNVPISPAANVCLLPQFTNRSKKNLTIYERIDKDPMLKPDIDKILSVLYPSRSDLEYIKSANEFTENNYKKFLRNRRDILIKKMKELVLKL